MTAMRRWGQRLLPDRRRTLVVASLLAGLLLVTACGAPTAQIMQRTPTAGTVAPTVEAQTRGAAQPVELVIWSELFVVEKMSSDPAGAGRYGLYLKEQFEKEHPGVTLKFEYHGFDQELRRNLTAALQTGTAPDIVVGENLFQQYAELGELVPLDDVIGDIKDNLIPATYRAAEYKSHIYALSAFTGVFGFERNCDVVKAAGLDCDNPPQTWDQLLEHARTITKKGTGRYYGYTLQGPVGFEVGGVFRIAVFLAQAGASICKDDCTRPYFNDPKAEPVMEFIRELNRYTPPGLTLNPDEEQVYTQLFQGLSAYQIAGSWHPAWAKKAGCGDCRYSPVPVPAGGKPASMVVGNVMYAVLQQSKHPDIAAQWVKFLARDEVQDLVYPALGRLPSTRSALTKLRPGVAAADRAFIDELLRDRELGILPQWRKDPQKLWRIYNDMLTQVLTTDRPVRQIMDEAQAAADKVVQE